MSDRVVAVPPSGPHGDDAERVARALGVPVRDLLDLATTLNPVAPDVGLLVGRHLDALKRYPDETVARASLAEALAVEPERVVLTNGGAEAIALVASLVRRGWIVEPEFSLYRRHLEEVAPDAPAWRSNPNNPTGLLAPAGAAAGVWDEAHYPLASGRWSRGDRDAIVIGSLTKLFACPGLRIGYVVATDAEAAAELTRRRPRWSVNGLATAVLPELVQQAALGAWKTRIDSLRTSLSALLCSYGLAPQPSDAPWVLVPHAEGLRDRLAARGVLVRDCSSFGLDGTVRIAVPGDDGLERLASVLSRTIE